MAKRHSYRLAATHKLVRLRCWLSSGSDGKQEMVNYRVKGDMYIVDRLFDHAELILGTGKKAQKVEIERERKS